MMQYTCAVDHDEVAFQLDAADFGLNSLWQTSYLKDNSWMSILQPYTLEKHAGYILCTQEYNSLGDPTRQHKV